MMQRTFFLVLLAAVLPQCYACPAHVLHGAIIDGDLEKVREILRHHPACITHRSTYMLDTPLHSAVRSGRLEMVQLFVTEGQAIGAFNINRPNSFKKTPMHFAAAAGYSGIVKYLHQMGASLDALDKALRMPLHDAAHMGRTDVVRYLTTQITQRRQQPRLVERVENFLNWQDKYGRTALHMAAFRGRLDTVKFLVSAGAALNIHGTLGNPLCEAIARGKVPVAEFLIIQGASIGCEQTEVHLVNVLPHWQELHAVLPRTLEEAYPSTRLPTDLNQLILEYLSDVWQPNHNQGDDRVPL